MSEVKGLTRTDDEKREEKKEGEEEVEEEEDEELRDYFVPTTNNFFAYEQDAAGGEEPIEPASILSRKKFREREQELGIRMDWRIGSESSEGALFVVCDSGAVSKERCTKVAKIINARKLKQLESSLREVFFHQFLAPLGITPQYYGAFARYEYTSSNRFRECLNYAQLDIIMQRFDGDVYSLIESRERHYLTQNELDRLFQIAIEMGKWGVVHGDLKLDQFLYRLISSKQNEIVVTDFGFTGFLEEVIEEDHYRPAIGWLANEQAPEYKCPRSHNTLDLCSFTKINLRDKKFVSQFISALESEIRPPRGAPRDWWKKTSQLYLKSLQEAKLRTVEDVLIADVPEEYDPPAELQDLHQQVIQFFRRQVNCSGAEAIRFAIETNVLQLEASILHDFPDLVILTNDRKEKYFAPVTGIVPDSFALNVCTGFLPIRNAALEARGVDNTYSFNLTSHLDA